MVTVVRRRTSAETVAVRTSKTPTASRRASTPAASRRASPPTEVTSEPPQFPTLDTRVLRQGVRGALRAAILNGRLKPGDRIIEADIAAQMGVSRAPVREAVRQLEQEGLVEFFPHRGATVVGVPEEEIDAIYGLRALIEEQAIRRACHLATDEDLVALGGLFKKIETAVNSENVDAVAEADLQFHAAILRISGYRLLRHMWEGMDGLVRVRSYQAFLRRGPVGQYFRRTAASDHKPILDALRARDPERAGLAVRKHILNVAERLSPKR